MGGTLSGFRYAEVRFDKAARLVAAADREAAAGIVADPAITDVLVLAHGWNNNMDQARSLYQALARSLRGAFDGGDGARLPGRTLALLGVLWPSRKFTDADLIPGGAASFGEPAPEQDVEGLLEELQGVFDAADADTKLAEAKALLPQLEDSAQARRDFADLIRAVLPADATEDEDASSQFFEVPGDALLAQLEAPGFDTGDLDEPAFAGGVAAFDGDAGDAAGGGAAAGFSLGSIMRGAKEMLNYATYYQMKARAGRVGEEGLAPLLREVARRDVRLHLVGHSFGARLVAAAAANPDGVGGRLGSVSLLQAAFSHYGFAKAWKPGHDGAFRGLLSGGALAGPVVITHTRNDRAVGLAYALASRVANQVGAELGGPDSAFGGLGANGAQKTPEAVRQRLLPVDQRYTLTAGKVHNLLADDYIADHSQVSGREVAHVLLAAVGAT